jgi:hypothetical protein
VIPTVVSVSSRLLCSFCPNSISLPFGQFFQFNFFLLSILDNAHSSCPVMTRMIFVFSISHYEACVTSHFRTLCSPIRIFLQKLENEQNIHPNHVGERYWFEECCINFIACLLKSESTVARSIQWTNDDVIAPCIGSKRIRIFRAF